MQQKLRILAITLLFFNGIGALWGGAGLIYDPSGSLMQMPLCFLKHSPFSNYLIPGIILFTANGLMCVIVAFLVIKRVKYYPQLTILQGIVLAIWLSVQIIMIQEFYAPLHLPFYLVSLGLLFTGAMLSRLYGSNLNHK